MTGRRFRGEADMDGQADSAEPDAFDPSATSASPKSRKITERWSLRHASFARWWGRSTADHSISRN